jgi:hypothetical protein
MNNEVTNLPDRWIKLGVLALMLGVAPWIVTSCGLIFSDEEVTLEELKALEDEIMEEIGIPVADVPEQCRTIAFGSKPCVGPWEYLVYSTQVSDEERLERLVSLYNDLEEEYNQENGIMSDCSVVSRPEVGLADGQCMAVRE